MEQHNLIILSTAHLHCQGGLVCMCDLLKLMREKHNADYVLFDPDANTTDELKIYGW